MASRSAGSTSVGPPRSRRRRRRAASTPVTAAVPTPAVDHVAIRLPAGGEPVTADTADVIRCSAAELPPANTIHARPRSAAITIPSAIRPSRRTSLSRIQPSTLLAQV